MKVFAALLGLETKSAFRSKQMLGLGLSLAVAFSIAVAFPLSSEQLSPKVASALMWMIMFFSSSDQAYRTFLRDEERGTADQLRLRVPSSFVFLAKVVANALMLAIVGLASSLLLSLWLRVEPSRILAVAGSVAGGSIALAICQGAVGFLLGFGKGGGSFYPLVVMPVVLPSLVSLIVITSSCIEGTPVSVNLVVVVCALSLAILAAGIALLPHIEV